MGKPQICSLEHTEQLPCVFKLVVGLGSVDGVALNRHALYLLPLRYVRAFLQCMLDVCFPHQCVLMFVLCLLSLQCVR